MNRMIQLIGVNIAYAFFCIWHLCFSAVFLKNEWLNKNTIIVISHVVPSCLTIAMMVIIIYHKFTRFHLFEKTAIWCICTLSLFYNFYILLTGFSTPKWVYNHNFESGLFILATIIFYSVTLIKLYKQSEYK